MKTLLLQLTTCVGLLVPGQALADSPLVPPRVKEVWSPNKQFCAVMKPKAMTTTVYRIDKDGRRARSWAMHGWFRVANLADDGEHLIAGHDGVNLLPLGVTKNEPMIRFFRRGELIKTVRLGELLKDLSHLQRTVSHYFWGDYLGLDKRGRYVVETVENRRLAFDISTGRLVAHDRDVRHR